MEVVRDMAIAGAGLAAVCFLVAFVKRSWGP